MKKKLSLTEILKLPFCVKKELKHPFALNVIFFALVPIFLVTLYDLIPVLSKVYSFIILTLLLYTAMVITSYLFYENDHN